MREEEREGDMERCSEWREKERKVRGKEGGRKQGME